MAIPAALQGKWDELARKPHEEQAIWFLNAFWNEGIKEHAEDIWNFTEKFKTIDPNGGSGHDHDEFWSHKFLEDLGETISVVDLRKKLGEIDIDKNKRMCLSEYLLFKYSKQVVDLVEAPQGDPEELARAQALVDAAAAAVDEVLNRLEAQKAATRAAREAEDLAKQREEESRLREQESQQREVELQAAKRELEAALAEVKAQEDAYNRKTEELKAKSEGGGVAALRAKNELAQHLGEDPLPLRRAKITQEAAVKKAERATAAAAEATAAAAAATAAAARATADAAAATAAAEESERQLEAALRDAEAKRQEALAYLDKVKSSGVGAGRVWWMKRGMYEKQKYLPTAKQTMPYPQP